METTLNQTRPNLRKLDDEIWKSIPGTEGKYEISDYGRVKSYCYSSEGKIVKSGNIKGYRSINLKVDGQKKTILIHKLVAETFLENSDESKDVVIHKDWNKLNNHVSNLAWLSREESFTRAQDKLIQARKKKGRIVTHSKLSEKDVAAIKSMLEKGRKQKVIAELFCVSAMQISRIKNNTSWSEV
ncbi:NUMOD4 domain-containing protein [Labilibacter marinus]|uniref:NUMOD4 domain-containing protein n=1 Tax=Labilibacter marinus TaxID=1477105 RepID=UPI0013018DCF|nr:NUMOD4 domain-containing protein [Labilibacter marinus]